MVEHEIEASQLYLSIIALVAGFSTFAFAQVSVDVSKITCKHCAASIGRNLAQRLLCWQTRTYDCQYSGLREKHKRDRTLLHESRQLGTAPYAGGREGAGSGPIKLAYVLFRSRARASISGEATDEG